MSVNSGRPEWLPKRVVKSAIEDNITGEAAKAAYYFFLSLFPLILALFALTGLLGGNAAFQWIMSWLETAAPGQSEEYLVEFVREITDNRRPDLLSISLVVTLWAASNFFAALGDGLDAMYGVRSQSTWWRKRLKALGLLIAALLLGLAGASVIVAGPQIGRWLRSETLFAVLSWPLGFLLVWALLLITYYVLPARDQSQAKREVVWGSLVGTLTWLVATIGFRLYVTNFGSYDRTYGAIGGVIVLMLWMYVSAIAVLLGGEVADVLERRRRR